MDGTAAGYAGTGIAEPVVAGGGVAAAAEDAGAAGGVAAGVAERQARDKGLGHIQALCRFAFFSVQMLEPSPAMIVVAPVIPLSRVLPFTEHRCSASEWGRGRNGVKGERGQAR